MNNLTPQNRLEMWLAKIAGENVTITPKDRFETVLAKIAGDSVEFEPDDRLEYWLNEIAESVTVVEQLNVTENDTYTAPSGKAYSPVVVNVAGGSSDYSTATVTVAGRSILGTFPLCLDLSGQGAPIDYVLSIGEREYSVGEFQIALWKGNATASFAPKFTGQTVSISGDITLVQDNQYIISGDCTITVSEQT